MRNIFLATSAVDTVTDELGKLDFGNIKENLLIKLALSLVVVVIGAVISKIIIKAIQSHFEGKNLPFGGINFLCSMVRIIINVVMGLTVASVMGIPINTALVLSIGIIAGLAYILKDNLVLIASGLAIMITKPFEKGDFVEIPDEKVIGYVTNVGLVRTTLRTKSYSLVCIPNNIVNSKTIINHSKVEQVRRVELMVPTPYGSDIELAKALCINAAKNCDYVKKNRKIVAWVNDLGESAVIIRLTCYVYWDDIDDAYAALREDVINLYQKNGLYIPFNQFDVHMIKGE